MAIIRILFIFLVFLSFAHQLEADTTFEGYLLYKQGWGVVVAEEAEEFVSEKPKAIFTSKRYELELFLGMRVRVRATPIEDQFGIIPPNSGVKVFDISKPQSLDILDDTERKRITDFVKARREVVPDLKRDVIGRDFSFDRPREIFDSPWGIFVPDAYQYLNKIQAVHHMHYLNGEGFFSSGSLVALPDNLALLSSHQLHGEEFVANEMKVPETNFPSLLPGRLQRIALSCDECGHEGTEWGDDPFFNSAVLLDIPRFDIALVTRPEIPGLAVTIPNTSPVKREELIAFVGFPYMDSVTGEHMNELPEEVMDNVYEKISLVKDERTFGFGKLLETATNKDAAEEYALEGSTAFNTLGKSGGGAFDRNGGLRGIISGRGSTYESAGEIEAEGFSIDVVYQVTHARFSSLYAFDQAFALKKLLSAYELKRPARHELIDFVLGHLRSLQPFQHDEDSIETSVNEVRQNLIRRLSERKRYFARLGNQLTAALDAGQLEQAASKIGGLFMNLATDRESGLMTIVESLQDRLTPNFWLAAVEKFMGAHRRGTLYCWAHTEKATLTALVNANQSLTDVERDLLEALDF